MREKGSAGLVVDHAFELACAACLRADEVFFSVKCGFVDVVCSADGAHFHLEGVSQFVCRLVFSGGEGELSFVAEEGSSVRHAG